MGSEVRVLCVDDNYLVREALRLQLEKEPGLLCVGELPDTYSLLEHIERTAPDIVILDYDVPGPEPLDLIGEINEKFPDVRVLILSGAVSPTIIDQAVAAGAWGYLSKNADISSVMDGIGRLAAGEFVIEQ